MTAYRISVRRAHLGWRATVEPPAQFPAAGDYVGFDRWEAVANRGWWRPTQIGAQRAAERQVRRREATLGRYEERIRVHRTYTFDPQYPSMSHREKP